MKIIEQGKSYYNEILYKTKKSKLGLLKVLIISTIIVMTIIFVGFKIIGVNNAFLKTLFAGIFNFSPMIGSGMVMVPWIIIRGFSGGKVFAIQLSILFTIIIIVRQIMEPFIKGIPFNLRPLISFLIFIVSYLISSTKGAVIGMMLIFLLNAVFELLDIQKYIRRNKRRALRYSLKTTTEQ